MSEIEIRPSGFASAEAQTLIRATMADLSARYGGTGDETPVDAAEFAPPDGDFLVARLDGEPVGCAGWRSHGEDSAELKRMYTAPTVRGRGVARAVLAAVEESARRHGRKRIILECGDRQPEAIALYTAAGYERIPNFGYYADAPGCLSFGRVL
ncbi:GNAT family N-acetyltransferase [Micromonospora rifamycinica]|uniref:Acetyltransferase (GNAT) family protein n=1 Tax=Micromonospora rifamycinica TaxID=291594 RepID=A0A109IM28_9ACTN|nr:GNAT family N-acetyltransferase [Micromonospora rifamycinica]KWV33053.1 acetyltransferase [Micromonospora rifamycinica]SCG55215.1 Acetyltransferase (GNAT) family protein [Micromonospora rifamycinica]